MGNQMITYCPTLDTGEGGSFSSRFEVDESRAIGSGKFSEVYLCWKKAQPDRRYALKVINTRNEDNQGVERIYEEIRIMKALGSHPHLVELVETDITADRIRVALELCEGGELYDRIQLRTFYPEEDAVQLVTNLLEAVAYIHNRGIMHRDLKPENILLVSKSSHTDIKISDFGLAKMSRDYPRKLPRSNSICGSDFYLAPEVIRQEEYGREIDIWSIGIVTYVLLSGSLPFFHSVLHKLYRQIVERDIQFPETSWGNVTSGAEDFILRLLQIRPGDRMTAEAALSHPWLRRSAQSFCQFKRGSQRESYGAPYGGQLYN